MIVANRPPRSAAATASDTSFSPSLSVPALREFARIVARSAPPSLKVLTGAQYVALEALLPALVSGANGAPIAKEARLADYIDLWLFESSERVRRQWVGGLAELDTHSALHFGSRFIWLSTDQMRTAVAAILGHAQVTETTLGRFLTNTRRAALHGYHSSATTAPAPGTIG